MYLLSIDPGRRCTGISVFRETYLIECALSVLPEQGRGWGLGDVCAFHASGIRDLGYGAIVVEQMSLNKGRDPTLSKAIATGNDLLELQAIGAFIGGKFGGALIYQRPAMCGKEIIKNRVLHVLNEAEHVVLGQLLKTKIKSLHHNVFDSIHHGLLRVGRFGRQ